MKLLLLAFLLFCGAFYAQQDRFDFSRACFNSLYDDFGVRTLNGKMYVISASLNEEKQVILDEEANRPFTDLYQIDNCALQDAYLKNAESQELWLLSSMYNDGAFTTNRYQNRVYFSHNNSEEIAYNMGIYYLNRLANGWSNSQAFPLNSENYNIVHPYFDEKSQVLYFSSNMPGGAGGYDIYKVEVLTDGFSNAEPVTGVNSSADEFFPHLNQNRFYFTSNRSGGLGGLDIYCLVEARLLNLSSLNSAFDDLDLAFLDENSGFFASNRASNGVQDDAYFFTYTPAQNYVSDQLAFIDSTLQFKQQNGAALANLLEQSNTPNILLNLASSSMQALSDSSAQLQKALMLQTEQTYAQLNALMDTLNRQIIADAGADYNLKMAALKEVNAAIEALKTSSDPAEQRALLAVIEKNLNLVNPDLALQNRVYVQQLEQQLALRNQRLAEQMSYSKQLSESSKLAFAEVISLEQTPENQKLKADFSNFMLEALYLDATSALKDAILETQKAQNQALVSIKQQVNEYLQTTSDADAALLQKLDRLINELEQATDEQTKTRILNELNALLTNADPKLRALLEPILQQYASNQAKLTELNKELAIATAPFTNTFKAQFIQLALDASTLSKEELQQRIAALQGQVGLDLSKVFYPDVPVLSPELLATFLANHQPENILFAFDSYELNEQYFKTLNDLAKFTSKYKQFKIFLDGHTDITGKAAYNLRLSKNRANSVRSYLEEKGLNASNFVISSFGFSKPAATNKTKEGRRLNRRVEIKLVSVQ
ncbi:MAG: OmpA family protein [Flavobacteriales bacterium]